jgi:cobalamin biosynthesis protein CobD/CbiB
VAIIIIFICLAIQKYLNFYSLSFNYCWVSWYQKIIVGWFSAKLSSTPILNFLLLTIVPALFIAIIFTVIYHVFDALGYWLLSAVLLWYCLDFKDPETSGDGCCNIDSGIVSYFHKVFVIIFWFFIGSWWLAFYMVARDVEAYGDKENDARACFVINRKLLSLLDWIPARVLGLSLALTSSFSCVFPKWVVDLKKSYQDTSNCLVSWFEAVIPKDGEADATLSKLTSLLRYSLILWLIVMLALSVAGVL